MQQQSAEYNVTRTYLEWLADLPWSKTTTDKLDPPTCRRCLDEDHFGLEKVKKRIVEYIAVRKLRADKKGPILCFIGPPGVGKTSLGRSIARSMGRRYHRIALGGVRDEAEIRGHRRTYVGALPGRIIQGLKKVGVKNPVFVLDEIDKLGVDMMGDPGRGAARGARPRAERHVPGPLHRHAVRPLADHVPRDREQPRHHPRAALGPPRGHRGAGLHARREEVASRRSSSSRSSSRRTASPTSGSTFEDDGIETIVESYTREAGVRGLEREIGAVCRHVAMRLAEGEDVQHHVHRRVRARSSSARRSTRPISPSARARRASRPASRGRRRAATSSSSRRRKMPGKGEILVTGNLKSVMQESASTAVSFVRTKAAALGLDPEFLKTIDLHLHVPKGARRRTGPAPASRCSPRSPRCSSAAP